MPAFPILILIGLVLALAAPCDARVLTGEVEHRDAVPAIEGTLEPGDIFDRGNLPTHIGRNLNDWYRIPTWLAGTWHKETQTDYYRFNYLTNTADSSTRVQKASSDGKWGTQMDSQGNVWQFDPAPYSDVVDAGEETVVQIIRLSEPIESTPTRFVKRSIDTQLRVSKATGRIKSVETGEQITIITPQSDVLIKRETSSKVFDHTGKAILLGKSLAYENKLGPFEAQNSYHGQDMRQMFQEFLKLSGVTALLPRINSLLVGIHE
jgi:hypothetical protein